MGGVCFRNRGLGFFFNSFFWGGCVVIVVVCLLAAAAAQLILKHIFVRFRNKFSSITLSLSLFPWTSLVWSGRAGSE
jgi:hypothetical protein